MTADPYLIQDPEGNTYKVYVYPDRRLKKSARWTRKEGETIEVRIPYRMPRQEIGPLLESIQKHLGRTRAAERRTDIDLQERAVHINQRYFNGAITWSSIRWVANMRNRLGSCTNGGATDGHIRISERIRDWPQWVVDYVIAHELAHRVHNDHSPSFWAFLKEAFPQTERAIGFIRGVAHATHEKIAMDGELES